MPISGIEKSNQADLLGSNKLDFSKGNKAPALTKFSEAMAPRISADNLKKSDPKVMEESIKKSKEFAIKMIMSAAKNQDPFNENSDKSTEMLQTSNLIAQLDSIDVQNQYMKEIVDAVKNPGFSATELQGKEVKYDDAKRLFDGKNSTEFNYSISVDNKYEDKCTINTNITIRNSEGRVVFTGKGETVSNSGEFSYRWDGRDNKGKLLPLGEYTMEVRATGKDDQGSSISARATTSKTAIVESVELENGIASKIILDNGKVVNRSQITEIHDYAGDTKPDNKANINMVGAKVELDFSKTQVKDGSAKIYYDMGDIKNFEDPVVEIKDANGKHIKTVEYNGFITPGIGHITLNKGLEDLKDGNYIVDLKVRDKDNGGKQAGISKLHEEVIYGVKLAENEVVDSSGRAYPAHMIKSLGVDRPSEEDILKRFIGQEREYVDDKVTYAGANIEKTHIVPKKETDSVLYKSVLRVYNSENKLVSRQEFTHDALAMVKAEKRAEVSQLACPGFPFNVVDYSDLRDEKKAEADIKIRDLIKGDKDTYLDENYKDIFDAGFEVKYEWDGSYKAIQADGTWKLEEIDGRKAAEMGEGYRFDIENIYCNQDGTTSPSDIKDLLISKSVIEDIKKDDDGNEYIILEDGAEIFPERIDRAIDYRNEIQGNKDKSDSLLAQGGNDEAAKKILDAIKAALD